MQTLKVQVEESVIPHFLDLLKNEKGVEITDAEKLAQDPYFYERREQLHQLRKDIKNGKVKMIENNEFWDNIDKALITMKK